MRPCKQGHADAGMPGPMPSTLPSPSGLSMFAPSLDGKLWFKGSREKDRQAQGTVAGGIGDFQAGVLCGSSTNVWTPQEREEKHTVVNT